MSAIQEFFAWMEQRNRWCHSYPTEGGRMPDFDKLTKMIKRMSYREMRTWRNRLVRDIGEGWVYRHTSTRRTPQSDRLISAWINAEMNRRIWADPTISGGAR